MSKPEKTPVLDQLNIYFLFQLLKLRKIGGKNWAKYHTTYQNKRTKILSLQMTLFGLKVMVKRGLKLIYCRNPCMREEGGIEKTPSFSDKHL